MLELVENVLDMQSAPTTKRKFEDNDSDEDLEKEMVENNVIFQNTIVLAHVLCILQPYIVYEIKQYLKYIWEKNVWHLGRILPVELIPHLVPPHFPHPQSKFTRGVWWVW